MSGQSGFQREELSVFEDGKYRLGVIVVIFSVKDWIIITVAFMDHTVSVITIQLYCNNTKAAIDKT